MALTYDVDQPVPGVWVYSYNELKTTDTSPNRISPGGTQPALGSIQALGTFGGGTVKLQGSNDGTNWVDLNDTEGTAIGITSAGASEFTTSMVYIRPLVTGGTADDLDVYIALRG